MCLFFYIRRNPKGRSLRSHLFSHIPGFASLHHGICIFPNIRGNQGIARDRKRQQGLGITVDSRPLVLLFGVCVLVWLCLIVTRGGVVGRDWPCVILIIPPIYTTGF